MVETLTIFHWHKCTTDFHIFRQSAAWFAEILEKLGYYFSKRNVQIYVSVTLNSDRLTRCRFLIIHVLVDALWYVGHIDFLMKKKMKKNPNLVAVNLHYRRPSSISTSEISHVTKDRDWFLVYDQSGQVTHAKPVTDTEFLKQ